MYLVICCGGCYELSKIVSIEYAVSSKVLTVCNEEGKRFIIDPNKWFNNEKYLNKYGDKDSVVFKAEIRLGSKTYTFIDFSEDEVMEFAKGEGMDKEFFGREE